MFTGIEKSIHERIGDNIDYGDFKYFLMEAIDVSSELQLETKLKINETDIFSILREPQNQRKQHKPIN